MKVSILKAMLMALSIFGLQTAQAAEETPVFSHLYHIEEEGLECSDCHAAAAQSQSSADHLNPAEVACLDCHDPGEVGSSWPALPHDLIFSHQSHVDQDMDCLSCHTGIDKAEAPLHALPPMDDCMTCHNGMAAPRDCASCHTTDVSLLIPDTHHPEWKNDHGQQARISDTSCLPCHAISDCQECHDGGVLNEFAALSTPLQSSGAPELSGSAGTILQRAHGLNYRFWHAIEARGKGSACITCHDIDSGDSGDFCASCHNPTGNAAARPVWHGGSQWGALAGGVGSGGGRHAELARRDIENCVTCHDQTGDDPSCLLCHMDRTRGLGNDPQTHARAFAGDIGDGDFHEDQDANCFSCHVYKGPAGGDGFCGYCHGIK